MPPGGELGAMMDVKQVKDGLQVLFDGSDNYIETPQILNPADGRFSIFAWIKGGAPGQVIVSQKNGCSWLKADPLEGHLACELHAARRGTTLVSQTVIADGNWHRIGFTWNGTSRLLYVDDVIVAEDTQANLADTTGGLHIGASRKLEDGTFWSGLIDDVRIYDRVVIP